MDEKLAENIIEITQMVRGHDAKDNIAFSYERQKEMILDMAYGFEEKHKETDWKESDYLDELRKYVDHALAKELWDTLGDVPMDPGTECIERAWNGFSSGTFREDIWHWFESTFHISVAEDLMGQEENKNGRL